MSKWKDLLTKYAKNGLKKENMIVIILTGILLFIIAMPVKENKINKSVLMDSKSDTMDEKQGTLQSETAETEEQLIRYADYLEKRLEETLSMMEKVGKVEVMVTVSASRKDIVEKDRSTVRSNTAETDSEGGTRQVTNTENSETTLFTMDENGNQIPYVVQIFEPEIEGVMVVAEGAGRERVNSDITEAIQALFGVEAHKIKIVKMKTE